MSAFYLQVEAINLDSFVYDTNDISTIRGGGLGLLLQARDVVKKRLEGLTPTPLIEAVTSGASRFVWRVDNMAPEVAVRECQAALAADPMLRHATFAVATCFDTGRFREHTESLAAQTRWHQMRSPSLAFPSPAEASTEPCNKDQLRPATKKWRQPAEEGRLPEVLNLSVATYVRRERGALARQRLYEEVLPREYHFGDKAFTDDLGQLATDPERGNLNNKMALFYADGNDFGGRQRELCHDVPDQQRFDQAVQDRNKTFLRAVLDRAQADAAFHTQDGRIRIETLLWGGDEVLFVVPAWRGLHLAQIFFQVMRGWTFDGVDESGAKCSRPLTHAAGLVFCNHKAPIARMRKLAEGLANRAKTATQRKIPVLAYQILESFDHPGPVRQPRAFKSDPGLLQTESLSQVLGLAEFKEQLSRRKIHDLGDLLQTTDLEKDKPALDAATKLRTSAWGQVGEADPELTRGLEALQPPAPAARNDWHPWFTLNELWDYIVDPVQES